MPDLPAALHLPGSVPAPSPQAIHLPDDDPVHLVRSLPVETFVASDSPLMEYPSPAGFDENNPETLFDEVHTWYGSLSSGTEETYGGPFELEWQTSDVTWGSNNLFLHTKGFSGAHDAPHILVALTPFRYYGPANLDLRKSVLETNGIAQHRDSGDTHLVIKYYPDPDFPLEYEYAVSNESIVTGFYDEAPVPASFELRAFTFQKMETVKWQGVETVSTDEVLSNATSLGYRTSYTGLNATGFLAGIRGLSFSASTMPLVSRRYVFPEIPYLSLPVETNPMGDYAATLKQATDPATHLRDLF